VDSSRANSAWLGTVLLTASLFLPVAAKAPSPSRQLGDTGLYVSSGGPQAISPAAEIHANASVALQPLDACTDPFGLPCARCCTAFAFDPNHGVGGEIVMFGGTDATGRALEDTWLWDEGAWTLVSPPIHPCARHSTRMAFDGTSIPAKLVLFGGVPGPDCPLPQQRLGDTWLWDGTTWTQACTGCITGQSTPPARRSEGLAWDGADGFALLFGGFGNCGSNKACGDTWTWNAAADAWAKRCSGCVIGSSSPSKRGSPVITYSEARAQLILYGGKGANGRPVGETWYWGNTGDKWINLTRVNSPSPRTGHRATYDSIHGQIVMFGGCTKACASETQPRMAVVSQTWLLGPGTWTKAVPAASPSPRCCVGLAWDPSTSNGRAVLFGGVDATTSYNDTWLWDGTSWCQVGLTCTDDVAPSAPTGLSATCPQGTECDLSWLASSDNVGVSGYTIYRDGVSIATVGGSTLAYADTSVAPETTYTYTVDAFDLAQNHSPQSDPATVTTPP
jgi:hypothetical protein